MRRILLLSGICGLMGWFAWNVLREQSAHAHNQSGPAAARDQHLHEIPLRSTVDSLCVVKHRRELMVFRQNKLLKIYWIALGDAPVGRKCFQGDERTPEGIYHIDGKNPYSSYHKNLGISYPNARDREYARRAGRPPGGDVKIHGLPNGQGYIGKAHRVEDWTNGCIAVTDEEVDELYRYVQLGSPILILP